MSVIQFFILLLCAAFCCAAIMPEREHCQKPDNIKEAQLQGEWNEKTYPHGTVANYACLPGYTQDVLIKMACIEGLWWKIGKGQCTAEITCNPPNVVKGSVDAKKVVYKDGEEIDVNCDDGFVLQTEPDKPRKCTINGWEPVSTCVSKKCDKPDIKNGYIYNGWYHRFPKNPGSFLEYRCNQNYLTPQKDYWERIECTNHGWSSEPKCLRRCSSEKAYVENSRNYNIKTIILEGEDVQYTCLSNYHTPDRQRSGVRTCLPDGEFSAAKCSDIECTIPATLNLVLSSHLSSYRTNERVFFSCIDGFKSFGSITSTCTEQGWNPTLPTCQRIGDQCGAPPTVQFGDTIGIRKTSYKSNEYVEYKCPNFYLLKGEKIVRCLNGVWGEAPVCLEPCTAKEKNMDENNIQIRHRSDKKLYIVHGDTLEYACKPGYEAPPNTQMRFTCEHGKLGYPKCFRKGYCVLEQSTMLANNVHYNESTVLDNGQTIRFQCNDEMTPQRSLEATCTSGKLEYPKCTAARGCAAPEILNGRLKTPKDSYDSGDYAEFECNDDYVKNSLKGPKCENGEWIDQPVCYSPCKVSSKALTDSNIHLLSSDIDKSYTHGTELEVSCKTGYRRPNQPTFLIECNNGKFMYLRCFSGKTCRMDQDGLDINSLELDEVHNNEVYYGDGETITFKCKKGFLHPDPQPTGTCSKGELNYPRCIAE
ncbi:complement factor H-related protein 4-like [Anomaloglossus baeobatrachus]|uniref:complement factor H-related protein 4-like n=1 Tax=Anomaloglossus baeobatrachus TaxID=238106 RepID=UPI003F502EF4